MKKNEMAAYRIKVIYKFRWYISMMSLLFASLGAWFLVDAIWDGAINNLDRDSIFVALVCSVSSVCLQLFAFLSFEYLLRCL